MIYPAVQELDDYQKRALGDMNVALKNLAKNGDITDAEKVYLEIRKTPNGGLRYLTMFPQGMIVMLNVFVDSTDKVPVDQIVLAKDRDNAHLIEIGDLTIETNQINQFLTPMYMEAGKIIAQAASTHTILTCILVDKETYHSDQNA